MPSDVGICDLAISINNKNLLSGEADANKPKERSLVFVGSKGVGKTTLIHRLVSRDLKIEFFMKDSVYDARYHIFLDFWKEMKHQSRHLLWNTPSAGKPIRTW